MPVRRAAEAFLANRRIAVTGVSRSSAGHGGNTVYTRLRDRGYEVAAVNPNAASVEGDPAFPDLASIPGGVDAVVIASRPEHALDTVRQCHELGVSHVWLHRAFGDGSVDDAAVEYGRAHGMTVIDGGCPLMFDPTADGAHKVMRVLLGPFGKIPRRVRVGG